MSTRHLLDPELLPFVDATPSIDMSDEALLDARAGYSEMVVMGDADALGVSREEIFIACDNAPDVRCLVYKPKDSTGKRPGYVHLHGGGYVLGTPELYDVFNLRTCAELGVVVVSVDYRLAPEYPIPAPLDDSYAALAWLHENAEELSVDRSRIAIGGESAGGGLAAALGLKARDEGEYEICWQQLTFPMLDDRTGTDEAQGDPQVGEFIWTRASNQYAWGKYLGDSPRAAPQVPSRAESLKGLPATWMLTAGLDLFRDENIAYAQRLMTDGVAVDLVVYPSACHAFQNVVDSTLNKRFEADFMESLRRGLSIPD